VSLLVIVPTRSRRANCERMLESFSETASEDTDILFISDPDDQDTYEGMDWGHALHAVMDPRGSFITKLNHGWEAFPGYDAYMAAGDSNVFITPGWDVILLKALGDLGCGWVYPENKRRNDVPEMWLASAGITGELGWLAPPEVGMYYGDNIISDLGRRSGLLRYVPEAVIEHRHYSVFPETGYDETYRVAETTWGKRDLAAFQEWRATRMPHQVAQLRRRFNKDVSWVLGKI
jgi:hypothetical protein